MSSARESHAATRFAIVGCTNFVVSSVTFYLCFHYLPPIDVTTLPFTTALDALSVSTPAGAIANVVAYVAGMINSFALNRSWTFRARGNVAAQAVRFAIVNLTSLVASTIVVYHFVDVLGYPELAVWTPMTVVVMVLNYFGCKHWAFARPALASHESR